MGIEAVRTDPRRLELSLYPFVAEVPPRFGDMDALRHLNNVALAAIYEEGRIAMHRAVRADEARETKTRTVIAEVTLRYLAEAAYPDTLQVACGVTRIGGASYALAQALFQKGRCVGTADTVIVNTRDHRSHPLSEAYREKLRTLMILEGGQDG